MLWFRSVLWLVVRSRFGLPGSGNRKASQPDQREGAEYLYDIIGFLCGFVGFIRVGGAFIMRIYLAFDQPF